jgi:dTDP-4-amino-4,6-dideoxygalactose transaminase
MSAWQQHQSQKLSFFGLDREFDADRAEYLRRVEEVLASGHLLQNCHVKDFERRLAGVTDRKFAVAVNPL